MEGEGGTVIEARISHYRAEGGQVLSCWGLLCKGEVHECEHSTRGRGPHYQPCRLVILEKYWP